MTGPTALVVVDVQRGMDDAAHWGPRNNPVCEANVARLLGAWRDARMPVVVVRHDSADPSSPLRPGAPGNALKPGVPADADLFVTKRVNSAFLGTPDLAAWLRERGIGRIAVCGITTNHCCETTARMGANLGFDVLFVLDATHTFDRHGPDGMAIDADTLARVTAANLHGEFAEVVSTAEAVERLLAARA